jgi:hypothetical protein
MRYSDVKTFVTNGLTTLGYSPMPLLDPGPENNATLQKKTPFGMVFLVVGNGPGLTTENLYDRVFIRVRAIGKQNNYDYAEKLGWDIDTLLLGVDHNGLVGTAKVLYVVRTGGSPYAIEKDPADRYHFQCSYVAETETGL